MVSIVIIIFDKIWFVVTCFLRICTFPKIICRLLEQSFSDKVALSELLVFHSLDSLERAEFGDQCTISLS